MCYSEWNANAVKNYVEKAKAAKDAYLLELKNGAEKVQFSTNSKLNGVLAVGTLPVLDCGGACAKCARGCYAVRHTVGRCSGALQRCAKNSAILQIDRNSFFDQIKQESKFFPVFRFNTEGEILDSDYFERAVNVAKENSKTAYLIFTKRHEIVNNYISNGGALPENLHVLLSVWDDFSEVSNPHNLPLSAPDFSEAPAKYRKPFEPGSLKVLECGGNCFECFKNGGGCFGAKGGAVVRFKAH